MGADLGTRASLAQFPRHAVIEDPLTDFQETPTAQELVAIAQALTGGEIDSPALGDVTFTAGSRTYLELVSPVDLLLVTAPTALGDILDRLQFGPLGELE